MKTRLLFTIYSLASAIMVMHAQDIITQKNGDEIKAKVIEVGINEVKYKNFENLSGPTYTIAKSDIFMIKYENGEKDIIKNSRPEPSVNNQKSAENQYPVTVQRTSANVNSQPNSTATSQASVQYQENSRKIQFGIKGGLNIAYESGDNNEQTDSRVGFYAGLLLEIPISAKVRIQPELVFSMQGGAGSGFTRKLDYINLPLMFKFYVWQQRLSIDAGPQAGYLISAKENSYNIYNYKSLKKFDVSFCVGVSYKITENFDASFRANVGITKIFEGYSNANTVAQLGIGYRF